jgi:uncharacterized delta-60 repeat protein
MRVQSAFFCCSLALIAWPDLRAQAADGDLDTSFGTAGLASGAFAAPFYPVATALLADGRILTAGEVVTSSAEVDIGVARFTADGHLDTSFSFDGKVLSDFGGNQSLIPDHVFALTVQADGKILICGDTGQANGQAAGDFAVTRLNADGSLDTGFGNGTGKLRVAFDHSANVDDDSCHAVAVQDDGKIVLAGNSAVASGNVDFAVARLAADGSLDTTFGDGGKRTIGFDEPGSTLYDNATYVAIDAQGSIFVGGSVDHGSGGTPNGDMAVAKLTASGDLDGNFNTDGRVTVAFDHAGNDDDEMTALLLQRDGSVVLAGYVVAAATNAHDFAAARLFPDGTLDTTFGSAHSGKVRIPFDLVANGDDIAFGAALQSDGKLVLAGVAQTDATHYDIAFARLGPKGALDGNFGTGGKTHTSVNLNNSKIVTALRPAFQGGRIVAAVGDRDTTNNGDFGVVRLQNDLIFADRFE